MDALRRRIILAAASTPTPERVSYIRGGGDGSYIDTGIKATDTTRVIVWARNWLPYSENLFGCRTSSTAGAYILTACDRNYADQVRFRFGTQEIFVDDGIRDFYTNYHKYEIDGNKFLLDDELKATLSATTLSNNLNIHLFGMNQADTHVAMPYPADIHACQIYQGGILVRDFVAVNSPSIGLYDSVTDTLFTNQGDGSFTYGLFNPNAYTPLEYIATSGDSIFHTELFGTGSMDFMAKYQLNTTDAWPTLFGAQTAKNVKRYGLTFGDTSIAGSRLYIMNNSQNVTYSKGSTMNGETYIVSKVATKCYVIKDHVKISELNSTAYTYTTECDIAVGTLNKADGAASTPYKGLIHYIRLGQERNYIPALVGGVAGLYDTFNDKFYQSETNVQFAPGPLVS